VSLGAEIPELLEVEADGPVSLGIVAEELDDDPESPGDMGEALDDPKSVEELDDEELDDEELDDEELDEPESLEPPTDGTGSLGARGAGNDSAETACNGRVSAFAIPVPSPRRLSPMPPANAALANSSLVLTVRLPVHP
jgi:hypothetical protein